MNDQLELYVSYEEHSVGVITYSTKDNEFNFTYDKSWIAEQRFLISPHIRYDTSEKGVVERYLENLLPEGKGLNDLATLLKVPKSNVFGLINSIGKDLSGGLSITADKSPLKTHFRSISLSELKERIRKREKVPITTWDGRPRLSLAGVQDKLPLVKKNNGYGLGEGEIASTHILKFGKHPEHHLVLNEYFCMKLAQLSGLKVADVQVFELGEKVLEVKRFDRKWKKDSVVTRFHIIDACQALDISPDHKYERFLGDEDSVKDILGPASLESLYSFCDECQNPAKTKIELLQWVLFNLLIGNSDNHFKNLSFFVNDTGTSLTPFYDLLSVTLYRDFNHSLAFSIGNTFEPKLVDEIQLTLMATELELNTSFLKRQLLSLIKKTNLAIEKITLQNINLTAEEKGFLQQLVEHIRKNIGHYEEVTKKL